MKLTVVDTTGKKVSTIDANEMVFAAKPNEVLVAQIVRAYLSNQRQGTAKVKTRGENNRTKAKWYKQKGTGRARHGSRNAPIFVGGGIAHGPTGMSNWTLDSTRSMRHSSLRSALTLQTEHIVVCDAIETLSGKTKDAAALLAALAPGVTKITMVVAEPTAQVVRSVSNLQSVLLTRAARLNTWEVAAADTIIISTAALTALAQRLSVTTAVKKTVKAKKVAQAAEAKASAVTQVKPVVAKTVKKVTVKKAATPKKAAEKSESKSATSTPAKKSTAPKKAKAAAKK